MRRVYHLSLPLAGPLMMNWVGPSLGHKDLLLPSGLVPPLPLLLGCILVFTLAGLRGHLLRERQGFSKGKAVETVIKEKGTHPQVPGQLAW